MTVNCQIFVVRRNGDVEGFADVGNALGASFVIWKALSDKYGLGFKLESKTTGGVEKLAYDAGIPLFERIALVSTFEGVWIRQSNMPALINALEDFASLNLPEGLRSTIQGISTVLRQAFMLADCIGVAFNQAGNCKPFWSIHEGSAPSVPYNITKNVGHFELFDELNLLAERPAP